MRPYLIRTLILVLFSCKLLWSQDLDSLRKLGTVEAYLRLGEIQANKFNYLDSLYANSQKALGVAKRNNNKIGEQKALLNIAIYYQRQNNFDTSSYILNKLTEPSLLADVRFNMALNCFRENRNKEAMEFYLQGIEEYQKQSNNDGLALSYTRMAGLFVNENQLNEAIKYGKLALEKLYLMKDPFSKLTVLSGLSGLYVQIGISKREYSDTAIVYTQKALEMVENYKYYTKWGQLSNSLSNIYYLREDYSNALKYSKQSLKFRNYLSPSENLISYLNLSDCYSALKQHKQALIYLDSVRGVLNSVNDPYYFMSLYERIYAYHKEDGNYVMALAGLERFKSLQDSLFNVDKSKAINELEQKYNRSENEKKISELNKENEIASLNIKFMSVGILAAVLTILVIIFFYRQTVLKNRFRSLETEQRLNRARINPHFFFNALNSIQTLATDKEKSASVVQLISKFSKIMRQSLESTYEDLITIESEIEFITSYVEIQKTRFPGKFDYEITVDDNLELNELRIPSMLLQPFIENSIEHGFKNIDRKGLLKVMFKREQKDLIVVLTDNGIGFNMAKNTKEYPSRATQIIKDRLALLNKAHGCDARFEFRSNEQAGVSVKLTLPCIYKS